MHVWMELLSSYPMDITEQVFSSAASWEIFKTDLFT